MANFDLRNFLTENKLTRVSKTLTEAAEKPTIKILKDLFYFDKLGSLGAKDDVDEKYHSKATLLFKKDTLVDDDTAYSDSEYKMITSSERLKKGVDYEVNENNLTRVSKTFEFQIGDNLVTYGGGEKVKVLGVKPNLAAALADTENPKAVESLKQDLRKNLIGNEDKNKPFYLVTSKSFPVDKYYIESELELMNNK